MTASNISAVLTPRLKEHVERVVGSMGLYENPGEYIRDLIRRDLNSPTYHVYREILEGFKDIKKKRYIKSTGDWEKDKALFEKREHENWS
uniref:Antitoxin ParD1/3/4 n=1 Tax=Candidatus Kentrum sp. LFY TaxID=2126342 RepID=A0A450UGR4_9GAMM|nr:MAG: antitoxin ParD1/3/4 [Candidatus Kentron sp. LFY]VFJ94231.1 MAG: antitoxin ParD1/3/4 [Candidatus Kentron sp. LFY]